MSPDHFNALFEFAGALFISASIYTAWKDKAVQGVSILSPLFFFLWGLWNPFYYASLDQWWSFSCGILLACTNAIWIGQLWYYSRRNHGSS